jgi:hypothetical protein
MTRHEQRQAIAPAERKVLHVDFRVWCGFALTPKKKTLFRRETFFAGGGARGKESVGALKKKVGTHLISAMVKRRMRVQIMPRMSLRLPSMISVDHQ